MAQKQQKGRKNEVRRLETEMLRQSPPSNSDTEPMAFAWHAFLGPEHYYFIHNFSIFKNPKKSTALQISRKK